MVCEGKTPVPDGEDIPPDGNRESEFTVGGSRLDMSQRREGRAAQGNDSAPAINGAGFSCQFDPDPAPNRPSRATS